MYLAEFATLSIRASNETVVKQNIPPIFIYSPYPIDTLKNMKLLEMIFIINKIMTSYFNFIEIKNFSSIKYSQSLLHEIKKVIFCYKIFKFNSFRLKTKYLNRIRTITIQ